MIDHSRRQAMSVVTLLAASALVPDAVAGIVLSPLSDSSARVQQLHSVDGALRIPAIAALFDEKSQAILQVDYADFEAVTRPLHTHQGCQLWALSVALQAESDPPGKYKQSLHVALDLMRSRIAYERVLLNVLTVFSCKSDVSLVSLLRTHRALLIDVMQPTGLYGFGAVADARASKPRMTMLCVTQPIF